MNSDEKEGAEIKISDKRRFNPDGTEKEGISVEAETPSQPQASITEEEKLSVENESVLQDVSFANLILSLAGSAQMSLGIAPNPFSKKVEKDLNQAKQTIDLLGVLEQKTKGNLSDEEASLMKVILSDLRMRYVEEKNKP